MSQGNNRVGLNQRIITHNPASERTDQRQSELNERGGFFLTRWLAYASETGAGLLRFGQFLSDKVSEKIIKPHKPADDAHWIKHLAYGLLDTGNRVLSGGLELGSIVMRDYGILFRAIGDNTPQHKDAENLLKSIGALIGREVAKEVSAQTMIQLGGFFTSSLGQQEPLPAAREDSIANDIAELLKNSATDAGKTEFFSAMAIHLQLLARTIQTEKNSKWSPEARKLLTTAFTRIADQIGRGNISATPEQALAIVKDIITAVKTDPGNKVAVEKLMNRLIGQAVDVISGGSVILNGDQLSLTSIRNDNDHRDANGDKREKGYKGIPPELPKALNAARAAFDKAGGKVTVKDHRALLVDIVSSLTFDPKKMAIEPRQLETMKAVIIKAIQSDRLTDDTLRTMLQDCFNRAQHGIADPKSGQINIDKLMKGIENLYERLTTSQEMVIAPPKPEASPVIDLLAILPDDRPFKPSPDYKKGTSEYRQLLEGILIGKYRPDTAEGLAMDFIRNSPLPSQTQEVLLKGIQDGRVSPQMMLDRIRSQANMGADWIGSWVESFCFQLANKLTERPAPPVPSKPVVPKRPEQSRINSARYDQSKTLYEKSLQEKTVKGKEWQPMVALFKNMALLSPSKQQVLLTWLEDKGNKKSSKALAVLVKTYQSGNFDNFMKMAEAIYIHIHTKAACDRIQKLQGVLSSLGKGPAERIFDNLIGMSKHLNLAQLTPILLDALATPPDASGSKGLSKDQLGRLLTPIVTQLLQKPPSELPFDYSSKGMVSLIGTFVSLAYGFLQSRIAPERLMHDITEGISKALTKQTESLPVYDITPSSSQINTVVRVALTVGIEQVLGGMASAAPSNELEISVNGFLNQVLATALGSQFSKPALAGLTGLLTGMLSGQLTQIMQEQSTLPARTRLQENVARFVAEDLPKIANEKTPDPKAKIINPEHLNLQSLWSSRLNRLLTHQILQQKTLLLDTVSKQLGVNISEMPSAQALLKDETVAATIAAVLKPICDNIAQAMISLIISLPYDRIQEHILTGLQPLIQDAMVRYFQDRAK